MAEIWAQNSHARRYKVAALIVKNRTIISDGYNGMPTGFPNDCEFYSEGELVTRPEVLHAEANAITKLARSTVSSENATLYVRISPCLECAKLIIQAGITRVVFSEFYRDPAGLELLKKAKIEISHIPL